jgi:hypothetical protein
MKKKTIFFIFLLTFIMAGNNLFPGTKKAKFDALFEYCTANRLFNGNVLAAEKGNE